MEEPDVTEIKKNRENKEYVLEAVSKKGKLLEWALEELQDDEEIVKVAVANKGIIVKYASFRLRDNEEIS